MPTNHAQLLMSLPQQTLVTEMASAEFDHPFLVVTDSLFAFAARVKKLSPDMDLTELQNYLVQKIHKVETELQQRHIRIEQIVMIKYFICSLLDDLLEQEWLDGEGLWAAYALRFYFFQEKPSDDRVFLLINRLQQEPNSHIHLIEVAYMILLYGYQGSYRESNRGYYQLLEKIDELYHILSGYYGHFRKSLFIKKHI